MSILYLDASAVVKRYSPGPGSNWVEAQVSSTANSLVTAEFTMAEVAAAIAAKHRTPQGISLDERDAAL